MTDSSASICRWKLDLWSFAEQFTCRELDDLRLLESEGNIHADPGTENLKIDVRITDPLSIQSQLNGGSSSFALGVNFAANVVPIVVNSHMLSKAKKERG